MKLFGKRIVWIKRTLVQDLTWGIVACVFGMALTILVVSVSGYYSRWFFALFTFIFGMVILFRFEDNWFNLWHSNKKRKKKKKYLKDEEFDL